MNPINNLRAQSELFLTLQRFTSRYTNQNSPLMSALAGHTNAMQVLFLLDTAYCQDERDDLKDAVLFFYPAQIPENQAIALCGQLLGATQFFSTIFTWPKLIRLSRGKFAIKKLGKYLFGLGSSSDCPDSKLTRNLSSLCRLFRFFHKDIEEFRLETEGKEFRAAFHSVWLFYIRSLKAGARGYPLTCSLHRIHHLPAQIYLQAQHLLQNAMRTRSVMTGCVIYKGRVVMSHLPPELTFYLCHFKQERSKNVTKVYVTKTELENIAEMNRCPNAIRKDHDTRLSTNQSLSDEENVSKGMSGDLDTPTHERGVEETQKNTQMREKIVYDGRDKTLFSNFSLDEKELKDKSFSDLSYGSEAPYELNTRCSSLSLLYTIAQESLKTLNIYEQSRRPKRKLKRHTSIARIKGEVYVKEGTTSLTLNDLGSSSRLGSDAITTDSSLYERGTVCDESMKTENRKIEQNEFISSWESESSVYWGKQCPIVVTVGKETLCLTGDDSKKGMATSEPKQTKSLRKLTKSDETNANSTSSDLNSDSEEVLVQLNLLSLSHRDTTCFLICHEEISSEETENLNKKIIKVVQKLDDDLLSLNTSFMEVKTDPNCSASFCDNLWSTATGDRVTQSFHFMEEFSVGLGVKSFTSLTSQGVAYAQSSVTHDMFVENLAKDTPCGIPSSKGNVARISQFDKEKFEKAGFYLLR